MKDAIPFLELRPHDPSLFHIRPLRPHIPLEHEPHRHNFQEILWVKAGNGRHQIDTTTLEIAPLTFYLIAKGQVHRFLGGQDLAGYLIRFTDDFLLESSAQMAWTYRLTLFNQATQQQSLRVSKQDAAAYQSLLDLLAAEYQHDRYAAQTTLLRHLLLSLLLLLEKLRAATVPAIEYEEDGGETAVYNQFLTLLEANYRQTHFVADYATQLGLSPRQLTRTLQRLTGRTAKQLIEERLILDAKRYLRYSHQTVKEISFHLGYKDPAYFSRIFRQHTNQSPKAYRG